MALKIIMLIKPFLLIRLAPSSQSTFSAGEGLLNHNSRLYTLLLRYPLRLLCEVRLNQAFPLR